MAQPDLSALSPPEATPPAPLGRFLPGRVLGRGATGVVYEATDTQQGRRVALKVLTLPRNVSPARRRDLAERFAREARAVSQLSHPSIVALSEFGCAEDGRQYLVMERLEGETLRARLQRGGPLLASEALPLLTQIADALQYAHGRGIVHRDVKPDNIFVCADGTAKLMDFGVARVYAEDGLTQAGTVIGSPAYMSPEQIGGATLDGRSDVFSLAVTLAEALTGRRPFEAPDIPAVMHQILHKPPQLGGVGSRPLRRALERALAKSPSARTPSAGALAGALRQAAPPTASALSEAEAASLTTLVMPRPVLAPSGPSWEVRWGVCAAVALALITLVALPLALRRPADPTTASVPAGAAHRTAATQRSGYPEQEHSPGTVMGQDKGEGWIVETTPATPRPKPPRPDAMVLQTLRDETVTSADAPPPLPAAVSRRAPFVSRPPRARGVTPAGAAPPAAPPETIPADAVLYGMGGTDRAQAPHLIRHTDPIYPPSAGAGTARLIVSVNPDGAVSDARVVGSSGDSGLDAAAIATVLHWQYAPALHDGRAVSANVAETVTFGPH